MIKHQYLMDSVVYESAIMKSEWCVEKSQYNTNWHEPGTQKNFQI